MTKEEALKLAIRAHDESRGYLWSIHAVSDPNCDERTNFRVRALDVRYKRIVNFRCSEEFDEWFQKFFRDDNHQLH